MSVSTGISAGAGRLLAVQITQSAPRAVGVLCYPLHGEEGKRDKKDVLTADGYQALPKRQALYLAASYMQAYPPVVDSCS